MKISELNGTKMKKALGASRVIKSYENIHVDKSGNFGFVLHYPRVPYMTSGPYPQKIDEDWFDMHGDYNTEGTIIHLSLGAYCSAGVPIPDARELTYSQLMGKITEFVNARKLERPFP